MRLAKQKIVAAVMSVALSFSALSYPGFHALGQAAPRENSANVADDRVADLALAERIALSAQMLLQSSAITEQTLRQSAAMLEVSNKLAPEEPRFLRLLTENYLQLVQYGRDDDRKGAIESLKRYIKLPSPQIDNGAWCTLFDLQYAALDTADERRQYIEDKLSIPATQLSNQIRSHIAVIAARLAVERAADSEAKRYTDLALKLMPLSPEALGLAHAQQDENTPVGNRVAMLLTMLRSNPSQHLVMSELAGELSSAGLVDLSLQWYQNLFTLYQRMGVQTPQDQLVNYASELIVSNQLTAADGIVKGILGKDPNDVNAAIIALLVAQRGGKQEEIDSATDKVKAAMMNHLGAISDELNGRSHPAADAGGAAVPPAADIPADVKKILETPDSGFGARYAVALGDLAWLDIYFRRKPADAEATITALKQLVPADSIAVTRLDGWSLLVDDKKGEARVKLAAVADRDPLAQLGMLQAEENATPASQAAATRKLLIDNADGLVGAIVMEAVRGQFALMPAGPDAQAIREELARFPREWLDIMDPSKISRFYTIKASTIKVSHAFGEPMLANVTISNTSEYPITIGPNGTIHSELWFDVQLRGLINDMVPGVAIDRITQTQILMPKQEVTLKVRVDQGGLINKINAEPRISIPLYFFVLTNPMTQQSGVVPGPGGTRQIFSPVAERAATPLSNNGIAELFKQLQNGTGNVRLQTIDLLASLARMLKEQQEAPLQQQGNQIVDVLRNSIGDRAESVRAEAKFVTAMLSDEQTRKGITRQMLSDASFCERLMGLQVVQIAIPAAEQEEWLKTMAQSDTDPSLKNLASAMIEVSKLPPPTSQPTSKPSEFPAIPMLGSGASLENK